MELKYSQHSITKSPLPSEIDGIVRLSPDPSNAAWPPNLLCAVDCVALPADVIVFGDGDESTNVEPVPSIWSKSATLLNNRSRATGVTALLAAVKAPTPKAFIAATLKTYAVSFVSPMTVALVTVDADRVNVVHVEPLLELYWMV